MKQTTGLESATAAPLLVDRPRFDVEHQRLLAGRCRDCRAASWPARAVCARCGSAAMETEELPATGFVESWTKVWVPLPGIETPYVLGQVRLGDVSVFGHVRSSSDPVSGMPVELRVHEGIVPPFWFEAATGP